ITDVVYVSYLVPAARVLPMVPPGLELQRLGPEGRWALFTFLTYRHGHFGFAFLGRLRPLMPSPIPTDRRTPRRRPGTRHRGMYFLTNAIDNTLQALAARLVTEGMPMHVLRRATLERTGDGVRIALDPGRGSAPDAELALRFATPPVLTGAWRECFADYDA